MYWNVSAVTKDGCVCFCKDVTGEQELEDATREIQEIADETGEPILITIRPRTHFITAHPTKKGTS